MPLEQVPGTVQDVRSSVMESIPMRLMSPLFLLTPLLFVTTAQAAAYDPPAHGEGSVVFTPAARPRLPNLDPQPGEANDPRNATRNNSRYGIGYDARHGLDTNTRHQPGPDMNAIPPMQAPARMEHSGSGSGSGGAGRGGRGR